MTNNTQMVRLEFERTNARDHRRQPPKGNNYIDPVAHADWESFQKGWIQALAAPAEDVRAMVDEPVAIGTLHRDCDERIVFESSGETHIKDGMPVFSRAQRKVVMPEGLREVWLFLDGQAELNGCVFGEKPEGRHNFWWRKELRAVLEELYPPQ